MDLQKKVKGLCNNLLSNKTSENEVVLVLGNVETFATGLMVDLSS